jgi:hypothetical protein
MKQKFSAMEKGAFVYALAQGRVVLEISTSTPDLVNRLEQAYFGQHETGWPGASSLP